MPTQSRRYESQRALTPDDCAEFRRNPSVNPITRRTINPAGELANYIRRRCDEDVAPPNARTPTPSTRTASRSSQSSRSSGEPTPPRSQPPSPPEQQAVIGPPVPARVIPARPYHSNRNVAHDRYTLYEIGARRRIAPTVPHRFNYLIPGVDLDPMGGSVEVFLTQAAHDYGPDWTSFFLMAGFNGNEAYLRLPEAGQAAPAAPRPDGAPVVPQLPRENMIMQFQPQHSPYPTRVPAQRLRQILYEIGHARHQNPQGQISIPEISTRRLVAGSTSGAISRFINQACQQFSVRWVDFFLTAGRDGREDYLELPQLIAVRVRVQNPSSSDSSDSSDEELNQNQRERLQQILENEPPSLQLPVNAQYMYFRNIPYYYNRIREILRTNNSDNYIRPPSEYPNFLKAVVRHLRQHAESPEIADAWVRYYLDAYGIPFPETTPPAPVMTREELEQLARHIPHTEYRRLEQAYRRAHPGSRSISPMITPRGSATATPPSEELAAPGALDPTCSELFSRINAPYFKSLVKKLKVVCTQLKRQCPTEKIAEIRTQIRGNNDRQYNITARVNQIWRYAVEAIFAVPQYGLTTDNPIRDLFKGSFDQINVRYQYAVEVVRDVRQRGRVVQVRETEWRNTPAIGEGTRREYIQQLLEGIRRDGFFIPVEAGSSRYMPNPEMSYELLESKGYQIPLPPGGGEEAKKRAIVQIYEWIGRIFAFCARMDVPTEFSLARSLLARLVFRDNEIRTDEDIMYYILDFPESRPAILNMMQDPDTIEYIGIGVNDEFPLFPQDAELTKENFREYLGRKAVAKVGARGWQFAAMRRGFHIRNQLRMIKDRISIVQLDTLLGGESIKLDRFRQWLATPDRVYGQGVALDQRAARVFGWFMEILQSSGEDFPLEEIPEVPEVVRAQEPGLSSPERRARRAEVFLVFVRELINFWSGLRKLDTSRTYQVSFIDGPIPRSSTCFYKIKLPIAVPSKEELYRRLVIAVFTVESGLGEMGGGRRKA